MQEIVAWLRKGDVDRARNVARHDTDKIHDSLGKYQDIEELLKKELFRGEEKHPWIFLEQGE